MQKALFTAAVAAAALAVGAAHAADIAAPKPADAGQLFTQLDVDKDNMISKGEAQQHKDVAAGFGKFDQNADGKLDANEFAAAITTMGKK